MSTLVFYTIISFAAGAGAGVAGDDAFARSDPFGLMMAMVGMGIVFMALLLLYIVFTNTPKFFSPAFKERLGAMLPTGRRLQRAVVPQPVPPRLPADLTGEVNAAIAAAIHLYRSELHDYEDTVLTIKKVSRTYSPWSSKIYSLRNLNMYHR
jgi:Na+-transporting methylmalonyl-CoA/oxaloacetate decarboxylase gamma subunit